MTTFADIGVSKDLRQGLTELGINNPTEIQEEAIPFLLKTNGDFIGLAQTGTGKTAAYGLPILQRINPGEKTIQALILAPTRELVQQIKKQLFKFTKYTDRIFVEGVYGGEKIDIQLGRLKRPTHIVVATPGRLIDLLNRKALNLEQINTLVLDEADEMLSMGFKKELDNILERTGEGKKKWLFSATMGREILGIVNRYMAHDAHQIVVDASSLVNANIKHQYVVSPDHEKLNRIILFLKSQEEERGIIFCRTKAGAETLAKQLKSRNFKVDALQGDLTQKEREKVMRAFKNETLQFLISTDVSARGIDVKDLAFVLHHQLPEQLEYYVHRSGRTARAGKKGISLALVTENERKKIKPMERQLGIKFSQTNL